MVVLRVLVTLDPRKIGPSAVMVAASAPLTAGEFVVCGSCAFNRYGDVRRLVKPDG